MGSVKDFEVIKKPTESEMGVGRFHFSDRYSVFDWGEMPDQIKGKGLALCMMGAYCFERLEKKGIRTHYRGLVDEKGNVVYFDDLLKPTNIMEFHLVNVYKPKAYLEDGKLKYDYSIYSPSLKNFLIPLEIIYRNGLPEGSSVFKRLEQGLVTIEDLGLDHYPKVGEKLNKPIFDVSTKLEESDRYITWREAKQMVSLTDSELDEIKSIILKVDGTITELASEADLVNEDGKIELAFDNNRRLMVADVVGTLDECRFTYKGLHVSKEIARIYYRQTEWAKRVERAKQEAKEKGLKDWRVLVDLKTPNLDQNLKSLISDMYMAAANSITKRKLFDVPSLSEIMKNYKDYMEGKI
ncbi:MAG: phosphoribosylaminoimidazolesuccinocarboxamide synthase [Nitrososphaerales archaeon]